VPPLLTTICVLTLGGGLRHAAPADVGMSAERLRTIDHVVERGIAAGGFPGAAVVVGRRDAAVWHRGYGRLDWRPRSRAVSPDSTLYDVASITKVVATTAAAMVLYDRGKLTLDAPVHRYLPAFVGGGREEVTVRDLLTHRSGLPSGRALWRVSASPTDARRRVLRTPLAWPAGVHYVYSDLGADVLGFVVEAAAGEPLDRFLRRNVYEPLGMRSTRFRPGTSLRSRTAPTETRPPRGYPVRGEVHDENAYALGGVAGHAGLFSTASDLAIFASTLLNGGEYDGVRVFSDTAVALFTTRAAGWRALGWDTCAGGGSCGSYLGKRTYGHTGFTGTSLWIDPDRQLFVIVLTNWVHNAAGRPAPRVAVLSDVRADIADIAALAITDGPPLPEPLELRADAAIGWPGSDQR
jgi:CubicO group peptidase (beta-lactamase class C family)